MAYRATAIPVMIATPSDVEEEREIVREVIAEWNDAHSQLAKVVLMPYGWDSHAFPDLGVRPQEAINNHVLDKCDLLVGVFWTRLGTPTGVAKSGTVEEIERHVGAGKPAMIYFSSKPVVPDSLDADQYAALKEFKHQCMKKGLIDTFDTPQQFRAKFSRQLRQSVSANRYLLDLMQPDEVARVQATGGAAQTLSPVSQDARTLLKRASEDKKGDILRLHTLEGLFFKAGAHSFGGADMREAARWEAALNELLKAGLVTPRGARGNMSQLTHSGWLMADEI